VKIGEAQIRQAPRKTIAAINQLKMASVRNLLSHPALLFYLTKRYTMKSSNRSLSFRILSLSAMVSAALVSSLTTSVARADWFDFDSDELSRVNPADVDAAEQTEASGSNFLNAGRLGVTVIGGIAAGRMALQQNTIARQRSRTHSVPVSDGSLEQLRATPQQALTQLILKDTVDGDVIRFEYVAGDRATLAAAVDDLSDGVHQWEARMHKLASERAVLALWVKKAEANNGRIPVGEQSHGMRVHNLESLASFKNKLAEHERIMADSEMRMHAARGQHQAARLNLQSAQRSQAAPIRYHVIRDILVDKNVATNLDVFFMKSLGLETWWASPKDIPHVRIVRIQTPHLDIAKKARRLARGGAVGVVLAGGLIVEEMAVGAIGESLADSSSKQLSPKARTAPRQD